MTGFEDNLNVLLQHIKSQRTVYFLAVYSGVTQHWPKYLVIYWDAYSLPSLYQPDLTYYEVP